jgi:signal transduction histidine kinase
MTETPLKEAIYAFALNILWLSIFISLITAMLVYFALNTIFVRPVSRLILNMITFRDDPEDAGRIIKTSERRDEIGLAERELAEMQKELATTLRQKSHLAALGLAVSKINHDLRNMLSSAQLFSDRLAASRDPTAQRFVPKLIASLDRAIAFCTETLRYGRAEEAAPVLQKFKLRPLIEEVAEGLGLPSHRRIAWKLEIDEALDIEADRAQLSRIMTNLVRNAVQVLEGPPETLRPEITVSAKCEPEAAIISVRDNGPGVPRRARDNLFQAFQGSARAGGTGLGLAISAELTRAHGGEISLDDAGQGTVFHVRLPASQGDVVDFPQNEKNPDTGTLAFGAPKH